MDVLELFKWLLQQVVVRESRILGLGSFPGLVEVLRLNLRKLPSDGPFRPGVVDLLGMVLVYLGQSGRAMVANDVAYYPLGANDRGSSV